MTYADLETSRAAARPLRLYLFERGAMRWAYANADRDVTYQGVNYASLPILDDGIRLTGETSADQLTMTVPADFALARQYRAAAPSDDIWLTIRDSHFGLPDAPDAAAVVWVGYIRGVRWGDAGQAEIFLNSISSSMGQLGLRLCYERACPHALYDTECRVISTSFKLATSIAAINGAALTATATLGNIYSGGIVEWNDALVTERRGVEAQSGNTLTLLGGTFGLAAGQTIFVYPGCDQTINTCDSRFGNVLNYGGFRHMPGVSPFENNPFF